MEPCVVMGIAQQIDLKGLAQAPLCGTTQLHRGALSLDPDQGNCFVFDYGVVVFWGLDPEHIDRYLGLVQPYLKDALLPPEVERFPFSCDAQQPGIRLDHIHLRSETPAERLSIAHGLAQSLKLNLFETEIQRTIDATAHIPKNIARDGRSRLSRHQIARARGRLFLVRSEINVRSDLLDVPEFFWDHPELQPDYEQTIGYLELRTRVEVLNKRLGVIQELFEMLADEQKHKHSSLLEWIIIWLIAIEILIFLYEDLL